MAYIYDPSAWQTAEKDGSQSLLASQSHQNSRPLIQRKTLPQKTKSRTIQEDNGVDLWILHAFRITCVCVWSSEGFSALAVKKGTRPLSVVLAG